MVEPLHLLGQHVGFQTAGQFIVVDFDIEFEVQPKAAHVPVGAADHAPCSIHHQHLGMLERRLVEPDAAALGKQRGDVGAHGPVHQVVIGRLGHDDIDLHATHRGERERGQKPVIGEEVRCYQADGVARAGDGLQHDIGDLFEILIGAGGDHPRDRGAPLIEIGIPVHHRRGPRRFRTTSRARRHRRAVTPPARRCGNACREQAPSGWSPSRSAPRCSSRR